MDPQPYLILDSVGFVDDFYLSLLATHGSSLAISLGSQVHIKNGDCICAFPIGSMVTSVEFLNSHRIAIGTERSILEIWDVVKQQKISSLDLSACGAETEEGASTEGVHNRIPILKGGSSEHVVYGGMRSGTLFGVDVRSIGAGSIPSTASIFLRNAHSMELCGLAFNKETQLLASGGNDNLLRIWDIRKCKSGTSPSRSSRYGTMRPLFHLEDHQAAIRALVSVP